MRSMHGPWMCAAALGALGLWGCTTSESNSTTGGEPAGPSTSSGSATSSTGGGSTATGGGTSSGGTSAASNSGGGASGTVSSSNGAGSTGGTSSASGAATSGGGSSGYLPGPEVCLPSQVMGAPAVRLLTRAEYNNTVRDLLGDNSRPADVFPREPLTAGLDNNAEFNRVTPLLVERYLNAAEDVALHAVETPERLALLVGCDVAVVGAEVCGATFVDALAPSAFRRPPKLEERSALVNLFNTANTLQGFSTAVRLTVQALLQSPQFLYRVEAVPVGAGNAVPLLDSFTVASRLSYLLWGTMPDATLLAAAANHELLTQAQVEAQVNRMMADARAQEGLRNFFRQWLRTDTVLGVQKNTSVYPEYVDALRQSWQAGIHAYVDEVLWSGTGTLNELLTGEFMMVDSRMAPIYGQTVAPTRMTRVETPGTRAGVLTQPGMMAMLAHPDQGAPVRRGIMVREQLLCEHLDPPPPGLAITPPNPDPSMTTRERFNEHTENETCYGCHVRMDPVGFGFENFDGLGRYRTTENGRPVDVSGAVEAVLDPADPENSDFLLEGPFVGPKELGAKLAGSPQVQRCVVKNVFRYAFGRVENPTADACTLEGMKNVFARTGGNLKELFVAAAISTALRTTVAPQEVP